MSRVKEIEDEVVSIMKRIDPKTTGELFLRDRYHTNPNNWTKVDLTTIAQAIAKNEEERLKPLREVYEKYKNYVGVDGYVWTDTERQCWQAIKTVVEN